MITIILCLLRECFSRREELRESELSIKIPQTDSCERCPDDICVIAVNCTGNEKA
jgi:hypothetical protein